MILRWGRRIHNVGENTVVEFFPLDIAQEVTPEEPAKERAYNKLMQKVQFWIVVLSIFSLFVRLPLEFIVEPKSLLNKG